MPARRLASLLLVLLLAAGMAAASARPATAAEIVPFTNVYNKVVFGDFNIIGNTVTQCPPDPSPITTAVCADGASRDDTDAVNDRFAMEWADVDANPATFNSSSASLTIPPGATVDHVSLHWAGDTGNYTGPDGLPYYPLCSIHGFALGESAIPPPGTPQTQSVSVKVGAAAATSVAPQTFVNEPMPVNLEEAQYYSATADITALFGAAPTGSAVTVTVGNVWTPQGYNCFGGWSLTLVYKYPQPEPTYAPVPREVFIYDGHVRVDSIDPPTTVPISGFRYPGGSLRVGVTAYEGDWGISGDELAVNGTPVTEPSGTGTSNFFVDSAEGQVSPNSPNNFSVDAKDFTLPVGTLPVGATSLDLELSTNGDSYLAQQVAFSVPLPTLTVAKEVCASSTPADCVSGGTGPWVDSRLLPAGSTAYWRIRVVNPSTVDIPNATLSDPAVPACETAAGTFAVDASETVTFYCNSPNLTAAVLNSVTAQFVPPGSPPGTPAVDTVPDTARADVHSLTVAKQACTSLVVADCVAGGLGPWVELATIPAGSNAHWRITVTNTGSVDLPGVTLNDAAQPSCVTGAGTFAVAAGATEVFYCATAGVAAGMTNTVTAQYVPPGSPVGTPAVVTAPDDARVRVSNLTIAKQVCGSTTPANCLPGGGAGPWAESAAIAIGATAYWRITLTNTGEADLTGIVVNDADEASCAGSHDLTAGSSITVYCSTANVTTSETNTATAQYVPPGAPLGTSPVVTPPDGAAVTVHGLALAKTVCASLVAADCVSGGAGPWVETANQARGSTVRWRITATNTGTTDLTGIVLNDAVEASCSAAAGSFDLAAGAALSFYCSTANITTSTTNTVTATYSLPGVGLVTSAPDSADVRVTDLAVVKEICSSLTAADCVSGGAGPWVPTANLPSGSTVYWRITVTNTGDVDLTGIVVDDADEASCAGSHDLTAGSSTTVYCSTANVTASTTNEAGARYVPPGAPVGSPSVTTPQSSARVNVTKLVVAKEVCTSTDPTDCADLVAGPWAESATIPVGSTAYWRITVTNSGDVDLTSIVVDDADELSCSGTLDLAAGASQTFGCTTVNLTANMINTVTARYVPPGAPAGTAAVVTTPDEATANVYGVVLVKEICSSLSAADCGSGGAGPWTANANLPSGSTAYWRITATNTGDLDLTDIVLTDAAEPSCDTTFDLAVGASTSIYCSTAGVTATTTNTATATYRPPGGQPDTTGVAAAGMTVTDLAVRKEICTSLVATDCAQGGAGPWVDLASLPTGSTAYWRITVTNMGDVDLADIVVDDPAEASCDATFDLAAGVDVTIHCATANVTAGMTNTVTAAYVPPGAPPATPPVVTAPDDATAAVTDLAVSKEICRSAVPAACVASGAGPWGESHVVSPGATAVWRITVTNTGEVDLDDITLHDAGEVACSAVAGQVDLAASDSVSFACATADVTANRTNTVTARYVPPGAPVGTAAVETAPDDATVLVADVALHKEVCTSACDGDGEWAETAFVHSGGTAYWRITVVNTGGVDLGDVTVQDPAEQGCVVAAFALPIGGSKVVRCSTADVTALMVNTATATYPLPGVPSGTPPVVTAPDTARVEVPEEDPPLAETGDDVLPLLGLGLLLIAAGWMILRLSRRRT